MAQPAGAPFDCLIEPSQVVEVRTAVDGLIQRVNVDRGDSVRRGQVLIELQSDLERSTADSARYRVQMEGPLKAAQSRADCAARKLAHLELPNPTQTLPGGMRCQATLYGISNPMNRVSQLMP